MDSSDVFVASSCRQCTSVTFGGLRRGHLLADEIANLAFQPTTTYFSLLYLVFLMRFLGHPASGCQNDLKTPTEVSAHQAGGHGRLHRSSPRPDNHRVSGIALRVRTIRVSGCVACSTGPEPSRTKSSSGDRPSFHLLISLGIFRPMLLAVPRLASLPIPFTLNSSHFWVTVAGLESDRSEFV